MPSGPKIYEVKLPPEKLCLKVTQKKSKGSPVIGRVLCGDIVTVGLDCGPDEERVRITRPTVGWMSKRNISKGVTYLLKTREIVQEAKETEDIVLQRAMRDSARQHALDQKAIVQKNIDLIMAHRRDVGVADIYSKHLADLKYQLALFDELLNPTMEWTCKACTYVNQPPCLKCAMCDSKKPTSIEDICVPDMDKLIAQLEEAKVEVDEEEPAAQAVAAPTVQKLDQKIELLTQSVKEIKGVANSKLITRVSELEEANWKLESRLASMENTIIDCVDLEGKDPATWTPAMVGVWLLKQEVLREYKEDFEAAGVDGEQLVALDSEALDELDVRRKHRGILLEAVSEVKRAWDTKKKEEASQLKKVEVEPPRHPTCVVRMSSPSRKLPSVSASTVVVDHPSSPRRSVSVVMAPRGVAVEGPSDSDSEGWDADPEEWDVLGAV